jgi:hypothetical protein
MLFHQLAKLRRPKHGHKTNNAGMKKMPLHFGSSFADIPQWIQHKTEWKLSCPATSAPHHEGT